ncbi:hypothetical protein U14_01209 [Candidatus Moduliflexus flocculans]|uniref:UPF0251 protein U14_01209 n=1 Tax=Candidatus Moduliflexus flocculans TaxID=1499966 RepID=A0A0S6VRU5_9BACT|nr:hypothetical protein U14_01209 [Candidatus Moduliflexus flocculans]
MSRPVRCRKIGEMPQYTIFKPAGIPGRGLEDVALTLDEFEAIRLADLQGLYQDEAARQMEISRQTFGNILAAAHHKVAECLIEGKTLHIEGGAIEIAPRTFLCRACRHRWQAAHGAERPEACPTCRSGEISCEHNEAAVECSSEGTHHGRRRCCRRSQGTQEFS